jgi:hypothetical protein
LQASEVKRYTPPSYAPLPHPSTHIYLQLIFPVFLTIQHRYWYDF